MKLLDRVCELAGARSASRQRRIQSLWSGYGEVVRVKLRGGVAPTAIVKHVRPPGEAHPRKLRSYQVEHAWYWDHAARCGRACRVPRCYGMWTDGRESVFVLEDLDAAGLTGRRGFLSSGELDLCLRWLAHFHATFLGAAPEGLWPIGTYWHLATRPDELAAMRDQALKRAAPELDARLNAARFQTFVHGDAKAANFCFAEDSSALAAVDFQYVGGGCGIKDVAYLLDGFTSARDLPRRLDTYFAELRSALAADVDVDALEAEWRGLYDVAVLDFKRFLDGW